MKWKNPLAIGEVAFRKPVELSAPGKTYQVLHAVAEMNGLHAALFMLSGPKESPQEEVPVLMLKNKTAAKTALTSLRTPRPASLVFDGENLTVNYPAGLMATPEVFRVAAFGRANWEGGA